MFSENVDQGNPQYDMWKAFTAPASIVAWNKTDLPFSAMGTPGPQALTLGCYAEGSSSPAGGSRWVLVSSLDNSAAYGWYGENAIWRACLCLVGCMTVVLMKLVQWML